MMCLILLCIIFRKESKLRPRGQLSKCVGSLGLLLTQTVKGKEQHPLISYLWPDINETKWSRFSPEMRRAVRDALTFSNPRAQVGIDAKVYPRR
jgi:hypothetical protein